VCTTKMRTMIPEEAKIEACARAAYEANRAYCIAIGEVDEAHPHWEDAPDWQKQSTRNGVAGALAGNTPEQSHESWLAEKQATGWKYGPVKDLERKEHPCVRAYSELPPDQRAKDAIYLAVVRSVATAIKDPHA
jgi:RyR domain